MNVKTLLCATAITAVCSAASAQETGDIAVGFGLSNFGFNLEGSYRIHPALRARGALMGGFDLDFEDTDGGDSLAGEFNLGGAALLADYFPIQGGWRVSGGLFMSNTELTAAGTVATAAGNEEATVTAKFKNGVSPMVTTGYDWGFANGWALTSEVGVIFSGGIDVVFDAADPAAQQQIDDDPDVQEAIEDASDLTAIPYLSIGISYQY